MPFYAVRRGKSPGVYTDWPSCQAQTVGFKGPVFKKFDTEDEAWEFVNGTTRSKSSSKTKSKSKDSGDSDSPPARAQSIEDSPDSPPASQPSDLDIKMLRASIKSLRSTAEQLLKNIDRIGSQLEEAGSGGTRDRLKRGQSDFSTDASKAKYKKDDSTGASDGVFTGEPFSDNEATTVYTDGASFCNGADNAQAGIGIYWGPNSKHNTSVRLPGRQTNNRAEIHAAEMAVRQAKDMKLRNLILHTDSQFLINGITQWIKKWKRNDWKLSTGGDVINREDFEKLDKTIEGMNIKWVFVRGHCGIEGNEAADKLANQGARKPLP